MIRAQARTLPFPIPEGAKMKLPKVFLPAILALALVSSSAIAQDLPYKEGSVWNVTMIKVKSGMFNTYIRDLAATRRPIMDEAKRQGLILSEKMLAGSSSSRDDFNMILLVEYKNWAAYDGLSAKFDGINSKMVGNEDKRMQINVKRADMREIVGNKDMQEVSYR
jgi:hypothetical protein